MRLFGQDWTRREMEARIGHLGQIGGIRRMMLTEGKEAGTELIQVRTGAGLAFDVTPSKGFDISLAELWGAPISWQSPNGNAHPGHYESAGTCWLRTASGGLLMTCGLSHVGSPTPDGSFGLHGRAHHTPARFVSLREEWIGDDLEWSLSGVVEETAVFGSKLRLTRVISGRLGENRISIRDRLENIGFQPAPFMMLYHFNFGFPLLGEKTSIVLPEADSEPLEPGLNLDDCVRWSPPDSLAEEAVYYHRLRPEADLCEGVAQAKIINPEFPAGGTTRPVTVTLGWSADSLPLLVQWRMPGAGEHALGLEPANSEVDGRHLQEGHGGPPMLEPGASVPFNLMLNIT